MRRLFTVGENTLIEITPDLKELLYNKGAKKVKTCVLLDKQVSKTKADYTGFNIPNEFVVGYGLDYQGHYRNLPYIGVLNSCIYSETR